MAISDIIDRIKNIGVNRDEAESLADGGSGDARLDSLRRMRQRQLNSIEKEQLKKDITAYNLEQQRKHLWGIKTETEKKKELLEKLKRKRQVASLLKNKHSLLKDSRKPSGVNILRNRSRFL